MASAAGIPSRFNKAFAANAGGAFIRAIPEASQIGIQGGAASLTDGFPPLNFLAVSGGGIPPFGEDMNGILNQISAWCRWVAMGGPVIFNAAFSTAIGGYPQGATLWAVGFDHRWVSIVDNNTNDPDDAVNGTGWYNPDSTGAILLTASTPYQIKAREVAIGLNRTSSPAATNVTLPPVAGPPQNALVGEEYAIADLSGNCSTFNITVLPSGAGVTICGRPNYTMDEDLMTARFRYYGSNIWGLST